MPDFVKVIKMDRLKPAIEQYIKISFGRTDVDIEIVKFKPKLPGIMEATFTDCRYSDDSISADYNIELVKSVSLSRKEVHFIINRYLKPSDGPWSVFSVVSELWQEFPVKIIVYFNAKVRVVEKQE